MKSGNLNFLEPSGPLQACDGTALPVPKELVRSYATLFLSSGKNRNVCCFEGHTDTPLDMKTGEFYKHYFQVKKSGHIGQKCMT